jgi:curved DNA-binding protein CbpA
MPDPYRILGVRRGASDDEIRKAYRKKAKAYHPDTVPAGRRAAMHERFLQLQEAYLVLSDPVRRKALDLELQARRRPWRRRKDQEDFIDDFFRNLLRGMMR